MTALPADVDVDRRLALARTAVLDATLRVRSPKHSTRFRVARTAIIAGAAAALLTAGAIIVAQLSDSEIRSTVVCFEHPDVNSQAIVVQGDSNLDLDPFGACAMVWQTDGFDADADPLAEPTYDGEVPDLAACTLPDGRTAVFPREDGASSGTDFCETLGLAAWDTD